MTVTVILDDPTTLPFPPATPPLYIPSDEMLIQAAKADDQWFSKKYLDRLSLAQLDQILLVANEHVGVSLRDWLKRGRPLERHASMRRCANGVDLDKLVLESLRRVQKQQPPCHAPSLKELFAIAVSKGYAGLFELLVKRRPYPDQKEIHHWFCQAYRHHRPRFLTAVLRWLHGRDPMLEVALSQLPVYREDPAELRAIMLLLVNHGGRNIAQVYQRAKQANDQETVTLCERLARQHGCRLT